MDIFGQLFGDDSADKKPSNAPHEAPADLRYAATTLFSMYRSFVDAGFATTEALQLTEAIVVASIGAAAGGGE